MTAAGLGWRATVATCATEAHRHAIGVVRAAMESRGSGDRWICERDLRDGLGLDYTARGRRDHLPNGVVVSTTPDGRVRRRAIEVELTRKTRGRVEEILRGLVARHDDIVYFVVPSAAGTVHGAAHAVGAADRIRVLPYPPDAAVA
jgi:hypothetical protein